MTSKKDSHSQASILHEIGEKERALEALLADAARAAEDIRTRARAEARSRIEAAEARLAEDSQRELALTRQKIAAELEEKRNHMVARARDLEAKLDQKAEQAAKKIYPLILPNAERAAVEDAARGGPR